MLSFIIAVIALFALIYVSDITYVLGSMIREWNKESTIETVCLLVLMALAYPGIWILSVVM